MTEKTKNILIKIAVIIIAGVLDLGCNLFFAGVLKIPLFLDTIFMIAVLFIFGPVESFFVYVVNLLCVNLRLYILYDNTKFTYLYCLSALTIILVTWFFVKRTPQKKEKYQYSGSVSGSPSVNRIFLHFLIAAITAAIACSVVSGIINYCTLQQNVDEWAFDKVVFTLNSEHIGMLGTCILGRIPLTVLDRIVSTFCSYGIYSLWRKFVHEK